MTTNKGNEGEKKRYKGVSSSEGTRGSKNKNNSLKRKKTNEVSSAI
jgi:hypothetical protein